MGTCCSSSKPFDDYDGGNSTFQRDYFEEFAKKSPIKSVPVLIKQPNSSEVSPNTTSGSRTLEASPASETSKDVTRPTNQNPSSCSSSDVPSSLMTPPECQLGVSNCTSELPSSRFLATSFPESERNKRLADDGNYYSHADFQRFWPHDGDTRFAMAPKRLERRKIESVDLTSSYQLPEYFFSLYGANGFGWSKYSKPGWDTAISERRLADDGTWYTIGEFQEFYLEADWAERWDKAPCDTELRVHEDGTLQNAKFFFEINEARGGEIWSKQRKSVWDNAPEEE